MRDPRRTPVRIVSLKPEIASFEVVVLDHEDAGARWVFPVWQASKFQASPAAPELSADTQTDLRQAAKRLNRPLDIPADPAALLATQDTLSRLTRRASTWLGSRQTPVPLSPENLQAWLALHDVFDLESRLATAYVSNPHAGECIKAHRITLAYLGLAQFKGRQLRDPAELSGPNALNHRKTHILARLAFLCACHADQTHIPLYRTIYSDTHLTPPRPSGFVSATYDRAVAERFLAAAHTKPHRALLSHKVPVERLFMTHHETAQMQAAYDEAEALLLAPTDDAPF